MEFTNKIAVKNIAKFSRDIITGWNIKTLSRGVNPSFQAVILKNSQETSLQAGILKHSQELEFTKQITGKNITNFSRGGIYKPSVQAEVFQNYQEVEFINHHYRQK